MKLSQNGKRARADQVHIHTTGSVSYARKKDEFKLRNKRQPNDIEFFEISHQTKKGSYVQDTSKELMDQARQEISKRVVQLGSSESLDPEKQSEIEREVMIELMGPDRAGRTRGYGVGVRKSQVTTLSHDLRRMRGEESTNPTQVHMLLSQIDSQNKQIKNMQQTNEMRDMQIKNMLQIIDELRAEVRVFHTAFCGVYGAPSKDAFFTSSHVSGTRVSPDASSGDAI